MRKLGFWTFLGGIIFALLPIASLVIAGSLANLGGCQLDESSVHPCILLGLDWGWILGDMAIAGWLVFFTIPVGGLVALVGLVVYVVGWFRGKPKGK